MSRPALRFSLYDELALPCVFERFVPGQLHSSGERYLPTIELRVNALPGMISHLAVVDRHHVVRPEDQGAAGKARVLFLLSRVRLQSGSPRRGLFDAHSARSNAPVAYGRVVAIGAWELDQNPLPYESLYAELLLDVGNGIVGVRTHATGPTIEAVIGKARLEAGDWIAVVRSRIDLLAFERDTP